MSGHDAQEWYDAPQESLVGGDDGHNPTRVPSLMMVPDDSTREFWSKVDARAGNFYRAATAEVEEKPVLGCACAIRCSLGSLVSVCPVLSNEGVGIGVAGTVFLTQCRDREQKWSFL